MGITYVRISAETCRAFIKHKLPAQAINIYLYLTQHSNIASGKTHNLKVEDIAEECGVHPATVYRHLRRLEQAGLYITKDRGQVMSTLPHVQLANHKTAAASREKR